MVEKGIMIIKEVIIKRNKNLGLRLRGVWVVKGDRVMKLVKEEG